MNMLLSSFQGGLQAVTPALQAAPVSTALIDGPKDVLWFGFGIFILIFVIALFMVIHTRVIAPSRRNSTDRAIFEPAGSNADITFDDAEFNSHEPGSDFMRKAERRDNTEDEDELADETPPHGKSHTLFSGQPQANLGTLASDTPQKDKTQSKPFAKLFSRKPIDKETSQLTENEVFKQDEDRWADDNPADQSVEPSPFFKSPSEPFEYSVRPSVHTDQLQKLDDDVEARRRRAELEDAEVINYGQNEFYARQHAEELREAQSEHHKSNAELEQRIQSLASMERSLTQTANTLRAGSHAIEERLDSSIDERFAALSEELNARLDQAAASNAQTNHDQALKASQGNLSEIADYVGGELSKFHTSLESSLQDLSRRIDHINDNPIDTAGIAHQLAELKLAVGSKLVGDEEHRVSLVNLVRENLPVERYSFGDPLPNGNSTDCKVKLTGDEAPLVIDANYPVGAYDRYLREKSVSRNNQTARNEYRRAILHHIGQVNEQMIVPGETSTSAMLYVPSDIIMNDLHNNFPDLIEDSHRARIWMVSPTSLMTTLQILNALAPSPSSAPGTPDPIDGEDDEVLAEIEALRMRLGEQKNADAPKKRSSPPDQAPKSSASGAKETTPNDDDVGDLNVGPAALTPEEEAFERLEREEKLAESSNAAADEESEKPNTPPPFPLR